jgi:hypothetical protein
MRFIAARQGAPTARPLLSPGLGLSWKERSGFWHEFARAEFLPPSVRCLDKGDESRLFVKALTMGGIPCEAGHRTEPPM